MEEIYHSLLKKFYQAVDSNDVNAALDCLSRLGRYGGYVSFWGDAVDSRGMRLVALENTSEAASALASFILLTKNFGWTIGAMFILKMTIPGASAAVNELIDKAWDEHSRAMFVRYRQENDQLLIQRQKSVRLVFIDRERLVDAPGCRIKGCRIARVHKPAHWTRVSKEYDGWVKSDGGFTLGIDPVLEANTGELVFSTWQEASEYAKEHGWRDVGIYW